MVCFFCFNFFANMDYMDIITGTDCFSVFTRLVCGLLITMIGGRIKTKNWD